MSSTSPSDTTPAPHVDMSVQLGRLTLPNPILVASGTFGYAREMTGFVDIDRLGAIIPKTVTAAPRPGNSPWRTIETPAGMLNSIGLDNDGIDAFIEHHLPYLSGFAAPTIVSIAGKNRDEFVTMAQKLDGAPGVAALELNISCPNVSGGVEFGTDTVQCGQVVRDVVANCDLPNFAKLTPNVTNVVPIARAAAEGGADAISLINTLLGMAVDWKRRRPLLGNVMGGLSGPAIKPVALRIVYQVAQAVSIPIVGIGGIGTIDDVLEFAVAGASAVQIGTANFYDPQVSTRILDNLPTALTAAGVSKFTELVGTLQTD